MKSKALSGSNWLQIAFIIYARSVLIYALITLPALTLPPMYITSMMYVLFYGWFAWALFTLIYLITAFSNFGYIMKMIALFLGVVVSVVFAFQMLEVLKVEFDIWHSGFLIFPLVAVISGWISLIIYRKELRMTINDNNVASLKTS